MPARPARMHKEQETNKLVHSGASSRNHTANVGVLMEGRSCPQPTVWNTSNWNTTYSAILVGLTLLLAAWSAHAWESPNNRFRIAVVAAYARATEGIKAEPQSVKAQVELSRICFQVGEYATNNAERALFAEQGIAAARSALSRTTNSGPAHFYLGLNLGQLARTRGLSALRLVDQMEREVLKARELDPNQDHAGPDRILGLLYRDAPSIGSVGSRTKARHHLQQAALVAPDFPDNRLNLLETYLDWKDRTGAARELKILEELLPKARQQLSGPQWEAEWLDWDARFKKAKTRAERDPKILKSPSQAD